MSHDQRRRALLLRLFGDFALRWFETAHALFDGDYEGVCTLLAVLQANVRAVGEDAALNGQYDRTPPPDELRKPVSLREAARSLGVPRERFRRRAALLVAAGAFQLRDEGYIVPSATIDADTSRKHCRAVGVFYRRLKQAGFALADIATTDEPNAWRQGVLRVMGDVVVTWARLASQAADGNLMLAVVFAALIQANDHPGEEDAEHPPRPISAHALALSLAVPRETVRRHVAQLETMGWARRVTGGFVVSPAVLEGEAIAFVDPLFDLTRTLFQRLADQGAVFSSDYGLG
ncbi:MAG: hypothetical protein KA105_03245 [Caulobacter sp.]|jgi:hypothetical protein|nr:hypothetical protein [Caulobacter sp.]